MQILLTGAGFSRNWGAWLADEVFEYLLGGEHVDDQIRAALWKAKEEGRGFEGALGDLRNHFMSTQSDKSRGQVTALQHQIRLMFDQMNEGMKPYRLDFTSDRQFGVGDFLARFDAIFTLNQDLLIERKYHNGFDIRMGRPRRWDGAAMPGLKHHRSTQRLEEGAEHDIWTPVSEDEFGVPSGTQPYFKLHGSTNWQAEGEYGETMIIGTDKATRIHGSSILRWYADRFDHYLSFPNVKLMVIGYGFGDDHINQAIVRASKQKRAGLFELFIVDPRGVDVLDKRDPRALIQMPPALLKDLQSSIVGASRRPFNATFSGNDAIEHSKLLRFFNFGRA